MISVTSIFSSMAAPYLLAEGSLLHLFRNCNVGRSDLDFSLEQKWWEKNKKNLEEKLVMEGFKKKAVFGSMTMFGYEEAWQKHG